MYTFYMYAVRQIFVNKLKTQKQLLYEYMSSSDHHDYAAQIGAYFSALSIAKNGTLLLEMPA